MKRKPSKNVEHILGVFKGYSVIKPSIKNPGSRRMSADFDTDIGDAGFWIDDSMQNLDDWVRDFSYNAIKGRTYKIAIKRDRRHSKIKRDDGKWCGHADHIPEIVALKKPTATDQYHNLFDKNKSA